MPRKKQEKVAIPKRYEGSEVVKVQKQVRVSDLFPEVEGGDIVSLAVNWKQNSETIELEAIVVSEFETFWVEGKPYRGKIGTSV
jgi:hypothetical protein